MCTASVERAGGRGLSYEFTDALRCAACLIRTPENRVVTDNITSHSGFRMPFRSLQLFAAVCAACWSVTVLGTPPAPIESIAGVDEIVQEVDAKITLLTGLLEAPEKFEAAKEKDVWQGFGVLAVMGQALAEHPQHADAKFSGAALRDAALKYQQDTAYADAQAALAAVKAARGGEGTGESVFAWNKLIRMHPMMEEINARNAKLIPIMKRPRGRPEEARHAVTIALLSLPMYADTHEVKKEADIPAYQALAAEYRKAMIGVAEAVRQKDGRTARERFDQANSACDRCHEKFRDVE
jgi:hypothetical protein